MADQVYVPPSLCIGDWQVKNECTDAADSKTIEQYNAEALEISGATINVFKLLGVHEQGLLIDLTGKGYPLSSGAAASSDALNAFDSLASTWVSVQVGADVIAVPSYIGYSFGTKKVSSGVEKYARPVYNIQHITTLKIQQSSNVNRRVSQVRVDRANGELKEQHTFVGVGDGFLVNIQPGYFSQESVIMLIASSATQFDVISSVIGFVGTASVGVPFATKDIRFTIQSGLVPFISGDMFSITLSLDWKRVDVVNLPNTNLLETISISSSVPSPFWRLVPLLFSGGPGDPWEVEKLELIDYQSTSIDNIQDTLFLENRDRDYAQVSIPLKCSYQPFDSIGDMGKFGFSILDQYIFTCSFARMVELLGRPVVVGDVIEVTPELAYDQHLRPVKKFLEVTDAGWSADGYTPQWNPILYRFQAIQLLPSQEVRDIMKMPQEELFTVSDGDFFDKTFNQTTTSIDIASDANAAVAKDKVPETGEDLSAVTTGVEELWPSITQRTGGMYVEDGLPPNGEVFGEGYKLPDVTIANDGDYYRLNYDKNMNIPARLYKFNAIKDRWIYVESDRRFETSSHKPSVRNALVSLTKKSLQDKDL
jgi:hypothetical protein